MECIFSRKGLDKLHGNTYPGIIQISDLSNAVLECSVSCPKHILSMLGFLLVCFCNNR